MVVGRVLRAAGCASCRLSLLRNFTSIGGQSIRHPQSPSRPPRYTVSTTQPARLFSSQESNPEKRLGEAKEEEVADLEDEFGEIKKLEAPLEEANPVVEESLGLEETPSLPWYLQVKSPERASRPLSKRQQIPELPELSPPVLQPLLEQVSIDLGLDDLTLLDLRKLDPPPALGSNLLMLIGTARSERHLHVSADRLCRWLRSTYKLRPDADGLLGRNELKLKLRRKAKRAKLVGKSADENEDDGMRTGWVCVDVGIVESAEGANSVVDEKEFVGFGRKTDGTRIVVQMLTEEKRLEIELEKLWEGVLRRSGKPELEGTDEVANEFPDSVPDSSIPTLGQSSSKTTSGPLSTVTGTRGFHTAARRFQALQKIKSPTTYIRRPPTNAASEVDTIALYDSALAYVRKSEYEKARIQLLEGGEHVLPLKDGEWQPVLREQLITHLQTMDHDEALESLGSGSSDYNSTPFLSCFYKTLSVFPSQQEVEARIWLHCFSQAIGHPGYEPAGLLEIFAEMQNSCWTVSPAAYKQLLRGVLLPNNPEYHGPQRMALQGALEILQAMHDQGLQVLDEDMLTELLEATQSENYSDAQERVILHHDTFDLSSVPTSPLQRRIHVLMMSLDLPCFKDENRLRLLSLYCGQQNWLEFWDIWRMAAKRGQPQTPALYAYMFASVAQTENQKGCMAVLRTWVPEMDQETIPIPFEGQVAEGLRACLKIADPLVEEDASNPESNNEWAVMWRKCITKPASPKFLYR